MWSDTAIAQVQCTPDTEPPTVTCVEFTETFSRCPDPIGPNTPDGTWFAIGIDGSISSAIGGSSVSVLDLSTCIGDNCSALANIEVMVSDSYEENRVPGCSVDIINEYMVRDESGNVSPTTFSFRGTLQFDGPAPVITCPANVIVECGESTDPADTGMATALSDCGTPAITFADDFAAACGITGVITRTWTATDGCGQVSTCVQTITIQDTRNPMFPDPADEIINTSTAGVICPYPIASISLTADPGHTTPLTPGADFMVHGATFQVPSIFSDACDANPQIYVDGINEQVNAQSSPPCTRVMRVRWAVVDACGNERIRRQLFTINDDVAPVPPAAPANVNVQCASDVPPPVDLTASDACQGDITASPSAVITPGNCDNQFTMVRTWTFIDDCGNQSSVSQTINVFDNTPPDAPAPPANVNVQCASDVPAPVDLMAQDNCDGAIIASPSAVITPGNCDNQFTMVRTWTFIDGCGNSSSVSQTINVFDNTPPDAPAPPANVNVQCASDVPAPVDLTAQDNCDGAITVSPSAVITPGICDNRFVMVRTWTFVDGCGNSSSVSQTITVFDDTDPTITCPAPVTVACLQDVPAADITLPVTDDNCQGPLVVTHEGDDVNATQCDGGTITRTYRVTDACGNFAECEQVITVSEPPPPVITCPADQTVECIDDFVLDPNTATATSLCGNIVGLYIKNPLINGVPNCDGTIYTYIYVAVDDCGRSSECEQQVLIENDPATLTVPAGGTVECFEDISISVDDATVNGACAAYNLYLVPPALSGPSDCPGTTYTYIYRLIDACGRTVEEPVVFTNGANAGPTIQAPGDLITDCLGGVNPNPDNAIVTTSCTTGSTVTVTGPQIFGPVDCNGTVYRYTYMVTDDCGRTATDIQDFTVNNGPPVFENCPGDNWLVLNCEDFGGEDGTIDVIEAWIASVKASTSCGVELTVFNNFNPNNINTCVNNGYNTVTFRATDNCGRSSFCTGVYVVVDTEAPEIMKKRRITGRCVIIIHKLI